MLSITGERSMSNSNTLKNATVSFPESSIVLLIHGYNGVASSMDDLIDTLNGIGTICNYYNIILTDIEIDANDGASSVSFASIAYQFSQKANANIFVKVSFSDDLNGPILEQSEELYQIICNLRASFPSKKIITVGYSKGGVVAMECAIDHVGCIDKLISIGTPYTTTIGEHLYDFVEDCVQTFFNGVSLFYIALHPIEFAAAYVAFANNALEKMLRSVVNGIINGNIVMPDLQKRWNQLASHPQFTPIATRALTINDTRESDFIVPTESALASGFYGKSYSDDVLLVKDDSKRITLTTSKYTNGAFDILNLVTKLNGLTGISTLAGLFDFASTFLPLIFSAADETEETKSGAAEYAHATTSILSDFLGSTSYQLKNETVAWRVIAGLQAE